MDITNSVAEAVDVTEEITMDADVAGVISEAITITNTRSITAMTTSIHLINMAHCALHAAGITILQNIVSRENMILTTLWKR